MKVISDYNYSYTEGTLYDCYKYFGNHKVTDNGGVLFTLWAPCALDVSVIGDFNSWGNDITKKFHMERNGSGIWSVLIPEAHAGQLYKYKIHRSDGSYILKSDPYAISSELRPGTASVIMDLPAFQWNDSKWLRKRSSVKYTVNPLNIYEIHLGSWKRGRIPFVDYENNWQEVEARRAEEPFLNYREIADLLAEYLPDMNYTHVELMPVCEHPLDGSWGYQTGNYYSVTSRYGNPEDFMYFVNRLHGAGIGVIADWVPGHFCKDDSWLSKFDGSYLYEYDRENFRENPLWGTANFDYRKRGVCNFLVGNAIYWLKEYHIDGLRVDAVANIIYHDYNCMHKVRPSNIHGGYENIEGLDFLRELNGAVHAAVANPLMIAEDSSTWPMVTKPCYTGGLGFDFKWNMGWMNDTLKYMETDPIFRASIHNRMTFSLMYAFSENYILPVSHDEVVHGKKTLLGKMFGTEEQKFGSLKAYFTYMICHPGKKLLFMGQEFGQFMEWRFYEQLEWKMLLYPPHSKLRDFVKALNLIYKSEPALYELDDTYDGFSWIDANNAMQNVFSFVRKSKADNSFLVIVLNMSPVSYEEYKIGVPRFADYIELINSDDARYGGNSTPEEGRIRPGAEPWNGQPFNISIKLPSYGALIYKPVFRKKKKE